MKHLKQSTCFDIGLIIDFDNTLFENEGDDWTVDNFTDERLKLRELLKMSFPDTILCSGRHVSQRKEIDTYLRKYTNSPNWYFLWEFDYDIIDEYRYTFMITYWKWKMEKIVELKWKYKHGVIVVDDDKVICDMCKKFEIPCVFVDHINEIYILSDKYGTYNIKESSILKSISNIIFGICCK